MCALPKHTVAGRLAASTGGQPVSMRAGLAHRPARFSSGVSSAVFGASGGVGDDARLRTGLATFDVADGTVQAISQDVELGTVSVGCYGV